MKIKKEDNREVNKQVIEKSINIEEKIEKEQPFICAGFGIAGIVSSYYLAFNLDFFKYAWISKTIIVVLLILSILLLFSTVNYYFKGKRYLMLIALGVLLIPCNFMWYMLWPCFITKIGSAAVFFLSIMFATSGFLGLLQKSIQDIKQQEIKNYTNVILVFIGEALSLVLTIIQFLMSLK